MLLGGVLGDGAAFFFSVQCKSVIGCWRKVMLLMRYLMYRLGGGGGGGILLTAWVLFSIPHRLWMYILFIDGDRGTSENRPDPFFASLHVIVFVSFVSCSLSISLSLSPHISVDWWSVHFPACRTYVDLTPQQDTNSFRAHDECNNHCPPTFLLLLLFHHYRHTDPPIHRSNPT